MIFYGKFKSIIRGVYGKYSYSLYVCVKQPTNITIIFPIIDFKLKEGIPSIPKISLLPLTANCDPNPTKRPDIISLNADVFYVYLGESNG